MFRTLFFSAILILLSCCSRTTLPEAGAWRAVMTPDSLQPALEIPFNMDILHLADGSVNALIRNAGEEILVTEITVSGDSLVMMLPYFEGSIGARYSPKLMTGVYTHRAGGRSWSIPFEAHHGITDRFPELSEPANGNLEGRWELTMNPGGNNPDRQIAEFRQTGNLLTGTILTVTGDYRFLEGKISGNQVKLSAFDGAHALVISASLSNEGTLENGILCGGPSWKTTWRAVRNDTITLPDPTTLTFLKPGYEKLDFAFPDTEGNTISLGDEQFKGSPMIVQIIGSWCPNCMDETRFLAEMHREYRDHGLKIVALCYESGDQAASIRAMKRFKTDLGAEYPFLYAGESNKKKASETLPMLNRILSYPTAIYLDRNHDIVKIFTGFSGPGTGDHYLKLTGDMRRLIEEILTQPVE